jgi:hypothetical protein
MTGAKAATMWACAALQLFSLTITVFDRLYPLVAVFALTTWSFARTLIWHGRHLGRIDIDRTPENRIAMKSIRIGAFISILITGSVALSATIYFHGQALLIGTQTSVLVIAIAAVSFPRRDRTTSYE